MAQIIIKIPDEVYEDIKHNGLKKEHIGSISCPIWNGSTVDGADVFVRKTILNTVINNIDNFAYIHCHRSKYKHYFAWLERCNFTEKEGFMIFLNTTSFQLSPSFLEWVEKKVYTYSGSLSPNHLEWNGGDFIKDIVNEI